MATAYGEGTITGIDLPGEAQGRVDSQLERLKLHAEAPKAFPTTTWYTGDNIEMAFGQGATVLTPLEQAVAYATFANGGTRYAPQVASEVVDPTTGQVVKKLGAKVTGHVTIPPSNYAAMLAGLRGRDLEPHGTGYQRLPGLPGHVEPGRQDRARPPTQPGPRAQLLVRRLRPEPQPPVPRAGGHRPGRLRRRCGRAARAQHLRLPRDTNPVSPTVKTPTPSSPPNQAAAATNVPLGTPTTTTTTTPGQKATATTTTTHHSDPGG